MLMKIFARFFFLRRFGWQVEVNLRPMSLHKHILQFKKNKYGKKSFFGLHCIDQMRDPCIIFMIQRLSRTWNPEWNFNNFTIKIIKIVIVSSSLFCLLLSSHETDFISFLEKVSRVRSIWDNLRLSSIASMSSTKVTHSLTHSPTKEFHKYFFFESTTFSCCSMRSRCCT